MQGAGGREHQDTRVQKFPIASSERETNSLKVAETDVLTYPTPFKRKALLVKQMGLSAI